LPVLVHNKAERPSSRLAGWVIGVIAFSSVAGLVVVGLFVWSVIRLMNPSAPVMFDSFEIAEQPAPPPVVLNNPPPANNPPIEQRPQPQPEGPPAGAHAEIVLPKGSGTILAVRYTPDGQTLVVATSIEQVFWYDANTRDLKERTPERKDRLGGPPVQGCAISRLGDMAAFCYHGGGLSVVEQSDLKGEMVLSVNQGNNFAHHKVAFSPDGKLLCVDYGHTVRVWDLETKEKQRDLTNFGDLLGSVVFAPDQSLFIGSSPDLHVLDAKTFQELAKEKSPSPFYFATLAFSSDSRMLAGGNDTSVFVYPVERDNGKVRLTSPRVLRYLTGHVIAVAFDSGSRLVVAAGDDRQVKCWNTENGESRESFNLQVPGLGAPNALAVRDKDHQLAVGCGDRVLFFPLPRFKDAP
jgi:WD40 repeat protein